MNPEEFEQALMRDIASASRRDPTSAWKAEILARATAPPAVKAGRFPRSVLLAWAACWALALVLHFMTPASSPDLLAHSRTASPPSAGTEWRALENRRETMLALLASNDSTNRVHP